LPHPTRSIASNSERRYLEEAAMAFTQIVEYTTNGLHDLGVISDRQL
jgi:hypothetical protein